MIRHSTNGGGKAEVVDNKQVRRAKGIPGRPNRLSSVRTGGTPHLDLRRFSVHVQNFQGPRVASENRPLFHSPEPIQEIFWRDSAASASCLEHLMRRRHRQEAMTRQNDTTRPRDDSTRRRQDLRKPQRVTTTRRHHTTSHDTTRYHATPPRDATTRRHDAARIRCSNSCSTINLPKAALRQPFDLQISRLRIFRDWVGSFEKAVVEKSANFLD